MIINCTNCNKNFNVDNNLIPINGRLVQCGSCEYSWFYKINKLSTATLILDNKINESKKINEDKFDINIRHDQEDLIIKDNKVERINDDLKLRSQIKIKTNNTSKFFSYLLVFVISFVMLIILLDTLKIILINTFPNLELILFNLFETIKDIKLFILDLI